MLVYHLTRRRFLLISTGQGHPQDELQQLDVLQAGVWAGGSATVLVLSE